MACLSGRVLLRGLISGLSALWLLLAGGGAGVDPRLLTWRPPALTLPTSLTVSTQTPGPQGLQLDLDPGRDYIIELETLTGPGGLSLRGGRNVVIVGGRISVPDITTRETAWIGRCLSIVDNVGTVHVEGVQFDNCGDGIIISAPASTVQIQNVRFNDVDSPYELSHSDVIQTWRGPKEIRIDKLTADFSSKGFLWMSVDGTFPQRVDQRRVNFRRWSNGGERPLGPHYFTWHPSPSTRSTCADCWSEMGWHSPTGVRGLQDGWGTFDNADGTTQFVPYRLGRNNRIRAEVDTKNDHESLKGDLGHRQGDYMERLTPSLAGERWRWGVPRGGDFVPARVVGTSYVSPGYSSPTPSAP